MPLNFLFKRHPKQPPLTADDIEVRIWGFVVIAVTMILCFIVVALLYSVTFVTQPIKSMAPIDQAYTKMLNDIVLLIVGGIGGVIGKRAISTAAKTMSRPPPPTGPYGSPYPPSPPYGGYGAPMYPQHYPQQQAASAMPDFNWMGYKNPELDESWTPGPPPTTPPEHLEPDDERAEIAAARKEAA
jgi:hypothetical protein